MSTQELAVIEHNNQLVQQGGLGLEDAYIRPTKMVLVQNTTKNVDAVKGKIFDELTGANLDEVQVVPLKIFRGRALFPGGNFGATPICRSDDGVAPSPFAQFPQSELCAGCSKGSWDDYDQKTGKGKPTCKELWQILFIVKETGLPRKMTLGGTSLKPFRLVLEQIAQDATMAKAKGEPAKNLFDYTFTISSVPVVSQQGSYYVAKFTGVKRVLDSSEYGPMYMQYVESARARREAAEEAKDAGQAVTSVVEGETPVDV